MSGTLDRRSFVAAGALVLGELALGGHAQVPAPLLKAAINGGRAVGSHPALPVTPQACALDAAAVVRAGAGAIHVHVRGPDGGQSIDGADLARVLGAMRAAVPGTPIGVSTQFGIVGDAARRHTLVAEWSVLPDFASVNFNEDGSVALAELLIERGVGVEAGLFDAASARACVESGLAARCLRLMLEPLGGDLDVALRDVDEMEGVLDDARAGRPRLLHGFRANAWPLIEEAARRGHQTRAGLEDTFELPDGTTARGNAEIVARAAGRIAAARRGSVGPG
jgi:uncharacterized protein (DUF849 family)